MSTIAHRYRAGGCFPQRSHSKGRTAADRGSAVRPGAGKRPRTVNFGGTGHRPSEPVVDAYRGAGRRHGRPQRSVPPRGLCHSGNATACGAVPRCNKLRYRQFPGNTASLTSCVAEGDRYSRDSLPRRCAPRNGGQPGSGHRRNICRHCTRQRDRQLHQDSPAHSGEDRTASRAARVAETSCGHVGRGDHSHGRLTHVDEGEEGVAMSMLRNESRRRALLTALAGCCVGPDYHEPKAVLPAQWSVHDPGFHGRSQPHGTGQRYRRAAGGQRSRTRSTITRRACSGREPRCQGRHATVHAGAAARGMTGADTARAAGLRVVSARAFEPEWARGRLRVGWQE